jgi:autophagy-related protein 2
LEPQKEQAPKNERPRSPNEAEVFDDQEDGETILSIRTEPIIISMTSTTAGSKTTAEHSPARSGGTPYAGRMTQISVSMGVIACSLRAKHVQAISQLSTALALQNSTTKPTGSTPSSSPGLALSANVRFRGLVVILLPREVDTVKIRGIVDFHDYPLVPPHLGRGYVRLFVDSVIASFTSHPSASPSSNKPGKSRSRPQPQGKTAQASLTITDISVFSFHTRSTGIMLPGSELDALPILITDPCLPTQYSSPHSQPRPSTSEGTSQMTAFPSFSIVDWTNRHERFEAAKPSRWRARPPTHQRRSSGLGVASVGLSTSPPLSSKNGVLATIQRGLQSATAISVSLSSSTGEGKDHVDLSIHLAPLHFFCDLGTMLEGGPARHGSEVLNFLGDCFPQKYEPQLSTPDSDNDDDVELSHNHNVHESIYTTPRPGAAELPRYKSAKPIERQVGSNVLDDLDTTYEYGQRPMMETRQERVSGTKVKMFLILF